MNVDNDYIANQFSMLSKLMDIHGENTFKSKSYAIAAFTISNLPQQLSALKPEQIFIIKGIGDAIGKKILQILSTGQMQLLQEYIDRTPQGVREMLKIKGLGPKKIAIVWKEMQVESVGELLYACNENRLLRYKGFGDKTQKNILETINFYTQSKGSYLYATAELYAIPLEDLLRQTFPLEKLERTGEFKRQLEIINELSWVTTASMPNLQNLFNKLDYESVSLQPGIIHFKKASGISIQFFYTDLKSFYETLFETSSSKEFLAAWKNSFPSSTGRAFDNETELFAGANIHFIPAYRRESADLLIKARNPLPIVIQKEDIKGIIHCHSNWSDGANSIEEMARHCIDKGFEYLIISDHSKSAFYANGLSEERLREQHVHIDHLNVQFSPFRIFKSIESDILNDGNLDYTDKLLDTFDCVIASVHSNLKMTREKAMARLLKAIENPHTTILGHLTGRLLLSRPGYPIDHQTIIDCCAINKVVIELNANPRRLDMDWRWVEYALDCGVLISIDPDAHSLEGYDDIRYGVLSAQKAGLSRQQNLSSMSLLEIEEFFVNRKSMKRVRP